MLQYHSQIGNLSLSLAMSFTLRIPTPCYILIPCGKKKKSSKFDSDDENVYWFLKFNKILFSFFPTYSSFTQSKVTKGLVRYLKLFHN